MRKTRRAVLRGMLDGAGVALALPFLECFLDDSGTALAGNAPIPVRFGTWFWGLGMTKQLFTPDRVGPDFDLKTELAPIKPVQKHINLFSNYQIVTDGRPSLCHYTGWVALRCGQAPMSRESLPSESIDVTVADAIGGGTRFRSLEVTATGDKKHSYSFRSSDSINPPEVSALDFYTRVFGPEFQDPNAPDFKPNPEIVLRKSVLSGILDDSAALRRKLGTADRARLDQYFTSLRELENRLAMQLERPASADACHIPASPGADLPVGMDVELVSKRHRLMTDILVAALACNQTRVFNMGYTQSFAATTRSGLPTIHHAVTHEELTNEQGYQPTHSWFVRRAMEEWAYFVGALASVREGDRTLLDNTLVFAHSDQEFAKAHTMNGIPMMTAGRAGGKIKSGLHVDGKSKHVGTDVGLTLLRAMGLEKQAWGAGAMRTTSAVNEILV